MNLDKKKLENVVQFDGKITARCPACQEDGHDNSGNHLVIYPDGRFGCVVNAGCGEHRRSIYRLVGNKSSKKFTKPFKCKW